MQDVLGPLMFARNGAGVTRYHTHPTIKPDTVAAHSHGVAVICYFLCDGNPTKDLLLAALFHDLPEGVVGDIPAPIKRIGGVRAHIHDLEDELLKKYEMFVALSEKDARLLKLADYLDGMLYILRERSMGNQCLTDIFGVYRSYIQALKPIGKEREIYDFIYELWRDYER